MWRSVRPQVSLLLCLFLDEESDSGWAFWNVVAVETLHPHRRGQRWLLPLQDAGVWQSCSAVRRLAVWRTNHGDRQLFQVHKTISGSIVYALKVFCFIRIDPVLCRKQLIAMATALESISRALRERAWARQQRVISNAVYQITLSLANFNKSSERKKISEVISKVWYVFLSSASRKTFFPEVRIVHFFGGLMSPLYSPILPWEKCFHYLFVVSRHLDLLPVCMPLFSHSFVFLRHVTTPRKNSESRSFQRDSGLCVSWTALGVHV